MGRSLLLTCLSRWRGSTRRSRGMGLQRAPPSAPPTPPHEWGGAYFSLVFPAGGEVPGEAGGWGCSEPLRRLRRHLPLNGEEPISHFSFPLAGKYPAKPGGGAAASPSVGSADTSP